MTGVGSDGARLLPGWALRLVVLVLGVALLVLGVAGRDSGVLDTVPGLVLLMLAAAAPGGPLPAVFLLVAVTARVLAGPGEAGQLWWRVPLEAALVHALHVLCALCAAVPVSAEVEVDVLRGPARRWLAVQAAALPVMVLVAAVVAGDVSAVTQGWRPGTVVLVVVLAALVAAALAALPAVLLLRPPRPIPGGAGRDPTTAPR